MTGAMVVASALGWAMAGTWGGGDLTLARVACLTLAWFWLDAALGLGAAAVELVSEALLAGVCKNHHSLVPSL